MEDKHWNILGGLVVLGIPWVVTYLSQFIPQRYYLTTAFTAVFLWTVGLFVMIDNLIHRRDSENYR